MNRREKQDKVNLLKDLSNGRITLKELPGRLADLKDNDQLTVVIWVEVAPGVYQDEAGNFHKNGDQFSIDAEHKNQFNVLICKFHKDGTPINKPASSEKQVLEQVEKELSGYEY